MAVSFQYFVKKILESNSERCIYFSKIGIIRTIDWSNYATMQTITVGLKCNKDY